MDPRKFIRHPQGSLGCEHRLCHQRRAFEMHGWGQKPTDEWPGLGAAQPDWLHYYTLI